MARRTKPLPRALEPWLAGVGEGRRRGTREPEDRKDQVCRAQEDTSQVGRLRPGPGVSWACGECGKGPSELTGWGEWTRGRGVWECGQGAASNSHLRAGGPGERGKTSLRRFPSNKRVMTPQLAGKGHPLGPAQGSGPARPPTSHGSGSPQSGPVCLENQPGSVIATPVYHRS